MKKHGAMELLAPAGNFESLKAAIANGADAVYLGGEHFNARQGAGNFSNELLKIALDYAGERGVKIYIVLNTLTKDSEMDEALQFAGFVYEEGAAAIIVQDIGLAGLLRYNFPKLRLHASTQMTITNSQGIRQCEEMGISRVILARELTMKEIEILCQSTSAEIEVFVHGALCISYSGQCLLSSFIGGRSGNRGRCAQPCRLPWRIRKKDGSWSRESYLLSPRDLMGLPELPALMNAGVTSLKIEGRMKSPEYVAVVTGIYSKYLDRLKAYGKEDYQVDTEDLDKLMQIFNRGGFSSGYLKETKSYKSLIYPVHPKNRGVRIGTVVDSKHDAVRVNLKKSLNMGDGIEVWDTRRGIPDIIVSSILLDGEHVRHAPEGSSPWVGDMKVQVEKGSQVWRTYSKLLMQEARESFDKDENRRVPLKAMFKLRVGKPALLMLEDPDGNRVECSDISAAEKAEKKPLTEERIIRQLQKTGDTPYAIESFQIETDGVSTLPISALNAMRRKAIEGISSARITAIKREKIDWGVSPQLLLSEGRQLQNPAPALTAFFLEKPQLPASFYKRVKRIYLPLMPKSELEPIRDSFTGEIFIWTPNIIRGMEMDDLLGKLEELEGVIDGAGASNPGTIRALRNHYPKIRLHADSPMNLFNSYSLAMAARWGASSATVSPELRMDEVARMDSQSMALEAQVYGRVQLMTLEYCPSSILDGCGMGCSGCHVSRGFLKDRKNKTYPYVRNPETRRTQLFSAKPIFIDQLNKLGKSGISHFRMVFTYEDAVTVQAVSEWLFERLHNRAPQLNRTKKEALDRLLDSGTGKGHWYRGV